MRCQDRNAPLDGSAEPVNRDYAPMAMEWFVTALADAGKKQADVARAIGRDTAAVTRIIQGKRKVQTHEIPIIATLLELSINEFVRRLGESQVAVKTTARSAIQSSYVAAAVPFQPVAMPHAGKKDLPVLGLGAAGKDGTFEWNGQTVDHLERPAKLAHVHTAYAIFNRGTSMEPRYFEDEALFIHPGRPLTKGCFVVVQLHPEHDGDAPRALVKQFLRQDDTKVVLHQFNPPKDIEIPRRRVLSLHRIVMNGEP